MEYTIRGHDRSICQDFERTFWIPPGSGYVREPTPDRPGTLAPQVCRGLSHSGGSLWAREDNFGVIIQRERARERRDQARENELCGC